MTTTTESTKVTAAHLRRAAYVYVRQSTLTQTREHLESLERQYELAFRAQALGWAAQQVVVVDEDLGRSGAESSARDGFKSLVADVGLGQVGIILGIEVSRLARNNADWYQLLDLCAVTDTLIADGDGVYHPGEFNDRLVLGLKGTMSEAELHLIRHRLTAGLQHKAAKGQLRQRLPVGFVHDEDDRVVFDPDEAVVEAVATVFRRFDELGSARQVMLSLCEDGLSVPRRPTGAKRTTWGPASYTAIHELLTNPAYAGAFAFGRTRTEKRLDQAGRLRTHVRVLPREEWMVLIPDHHPGFITWERYVGIQQELKANWRPPRGQAGGAVREGTALLQGRLRCGRCGRMMQTGYSGTKGNCPRYVCGQAKVRYGTDRTCQSLGGKRLEARVLDEVFAVLEPAVLTATMHALNDTEVTHRQRVAVFELAAERARFEADRARRQFDAVEPENRLVARTLERAWEEALGAQRQAEADLAAQQARKATRLSEDEQAWLIRAGADVRAVFDAPTTTWRERKQLLRALIREVVLTVRADEGQADITIVWEGGAITELVHELTQAGRTSHATDEDTLALLRRLALRYDDAVIAAILSRQGRRTGMGLRFTRERVARLRVSQGIPVHTPPVDVSPQDDDAQVVSVAKAAAAFGVSKPTIYRWLDEGFITGEQLTAGGPWHIRITADLRRRVVPDVPAGWVGLNDAARVLGVARQTVLHKVQRGELAAVYVNRGKRKGLRIDVAATAAGLFETAR